MEPPINPETNNETPKPVTTKNNHKHRIVIWSIVAVAVLITSGLVAYQFLAPNTKQQEHQKFADFDNSEYDQYAEVALTKDGFSPASLHIAPHTAVFIRNKDTSTLTLALNNPTQKDGPATSDENDPKLPNNKTLTPGNASVHIYERPDTYNFHIAEKPTFNLTIVVAKVE